MSNKLKISQNDQNISSNIYNINTALNDEWTEDTGKFWDDEIAEEINPPITITEPITLDEINHIKVINNNL